MTSGIFGGGHGGDMPGGYGTGGYSREQLRATFDTVSGAYQDARPGYPEALLDELVAASGVHAGSTILEVGCATGKATLPLAARGLAITCVELGAGLASVARRNLAGYPRVQVVNTAFETWAAPPGQRFNLIFAATAWHWVDPQVRYQRAHELLAPGGHLAFWGQAHVFPDGGDPFFRDIQDVYAEIGEGLPPGTVWPKPGEVPDSRAEIEGTGLFRDVRVRHFDWEVSYDADGYIALLDTFSGHIAMAAWQRQRLYGEIRRRLARRPDGRLRRHFGSVLHVARRRAGTGRAGTGRAGTGSAGTGSAGTGSAGTGSAGTGSGDTQTD